MLRDRRRKEVFSALVSATVVLCAATVLARRVVPVDFPHDDMATQSRKQDWFGSGWLNLAGAINHQNAYRGWLWFDLSQLVNSDIVTADLYVSSPDTSWTDNVAVNRFTSNVASDHNLYNGSVSSDGATSVLVSGTGTYSWVVTQIVQDWNGGVANYGFRLAKGNEYSDGFRGFNSDPYDPQTNPFGPRLRVYILIPYETLLILR